MQHSWSKSDEHGNSVVLSRQRRLDGGNQNSPTPNSSPSGEMQSSPDVPDCGPLGCGQSPHGGGGHGSFARTTTWLIATAATNAGANREVRRMRSVSFRQVKSPLRELHSQYATPVRPAQSDRWRRAASQRDVPRPAGASGQRRPPFQTANDEASPTYASERAVPSGRGAPLHRNG